MSCSPEVSIVKNTKEDTLRSNRVPAILTLTNKPAAFPAQLVQDAVLR